MSTTLVTTRHYKGRHAKPRHDLRNTLIVLAAVLMVVLAVLGILAQR